MRPQPLQAPPCICKGGYPLQSHSVEVVVLVVVGVLFAFLAKSTIVQWKKVDNFLLVDNYLPVMNHAPGVSWE